MPGALRNESAAPSLFQCGPFYERGLRDCLNSVRDDLTSRSVIPGCSAQGDVAGRQIINSGFYVHFSSLNRVADDR